jgi:hypothetical protein
MNYGAISQWIRDNHPGFEFQIHPELTVKIEKEISDYRRAISKVVYALGGVPGRRSLASLLSDGAHNSAPVGSVTALSRLSPNREPFWCAVNTWSAVPEVRFEFEMRFQPPLNDFHDNCIEALEATHVYRDRILVLTLERGGVSEVVPAELQDWLNRWPDARVLAGHDYLQYLVSTGQTSSHTLYHDQERHPEHRVLPNDHVYLVQPRGMMCAPDGNFNSMWSGNEINPDLRFSSSFSLAVCDHSVRAFKFKP